MMNEQQRMDFLGTLLSLNMARPHIDIISTVLFSPRIRRLPNISLNVVYIRIGRCVIKIDFKDSHTIVTLVPETILRIILLALVRFQITLNLIKNSSLSGSLLNLQLSGMLKWKMRRFSKMSVLELLNTKEISNGLENRLLFSIPKIIYVGSSQNVTDIANLIYMEYLTYMDVYSTRLQNADMGILMCLYGFVRSANLSTIIAPYHALGFAPNTE